MILYVENISTKDRRRYILNNSEDFEELFHLYPYTKTIALKSDNLEHAANQIAKYLSGSAAIDAWIEGTIMKNLKQNAALALGISAMPVSTGGRLLEQMPYGDNHQHQEEHSTEDFGKMPEDRFLWNIMQNESSGGRNTAHQPVEHGKMKGQKAMGRWGLLGPTVKDVLDRMKLKNSLSNDLRPLYTMNREQLNEHFEHNPGAELKIARFLGRHVLHNNKGDVKRAAYSWLHGHNLKPEQIPDDQLNSSDYVSKYKMHDSINPYKKPTQVKKSVDKKKESPSDFKDRINVWEHQRREEQRKPIMRDSTFTADPGRLREKELDEKKPTGIKAVLAWAIKQAKKDNNRG